MMMSSHHSHGGCPLALVILLLVSMDPTATEVVRSVSDCAQFFLDGTPPEIPGVLQHGTIQKQNRYKPICQTFYDTKRFMTLYDTDKKIPVFSAYRYTGHTMDRPSAIWKGEPQLETATSTEVNMRKMKKPTNQASLIDYRGKTYNKGHLFPSSHASDVIVQKSTFTLTNAVPQDKTFNTRSWGIMEGNVRDRMDELCYNQNNHLEAFVVTGAIPSANKPPLNNKVNIPTILWTAFCCYNKVSGKWFASAHWGDNNANTPRLETKTLAELNTAHKVEPFPNDNCRGASQS
ncbi:endonuclease domain-containing 1 protein-like [Gadus chalcogrammus]|uniref:endonuclease domain-containing 1 protein-like n=1 Tax=Gadus chalcogrammus TaxID=1042646 RepID=UPI0024C4C8CF|nr:endonuclease domain-containing 1 protein-like [Gadus chalcogrammus]